MLFLSQKISDFAKTEYEHWRTLLDDDKKARLSSSKSHLVQKKIVISDMLARKGVAQFLKMEAQDITFMKTEKGKPYAVGLPVYLSISHSGDWVVCAVNETVIGVDIEQIRPIDPKILHRTCSEEEQKYIGDISYIENQVRFFEIWTKKEAYLKSIGIGISADLKKYNMLALNGFVRSEVFDENYYVSIYSGVK